MGKRYYLIFDRINNRAYHNLFSIDKCKSRFSVVDYNSYEAYLMSAPDVLSLVGNIVNLLQTGNGVLMTMPSTFEFRSNDIRIVSGDSYISHSGGKGLDLSLGGTVFHFHVMGDMLACNGVVIRVFRGGVYTLDSVTDSGQGVYRVGWYSGFVVWLDARRGVVMGYADVSGYHWLDAGGFPGRLARSLMLSGGRVL